MATSVPEELQALSTTPSSNTPAGSVAIGSHLDDELRDIKANVARSARWEEDPTVTDGTTMTTVKLNRITPVRAGSTTASLTLTAPTAAAAGDGWVTRLVKLDGTGKVIIEGNASETINGTLSYTMTASGGVVTLWCDGSNYRAIHSYPRHEPGTVVGRSFTNKEGASTIAVSSPYTADGTPPLFAEIASAVGSLTATYSPVAAANRLRVRSRVQLNSSAAASVIMTLHADSGTAIAAGISTLTAGQNDAIDLHASLTASTQRVFTVGITATAATDVYVNRTGGAADLFGSANNSWLEIEEVAQ